MNTKSFDNIDQANEFIDSLLAQGKSWHIVRTSFVNVVYNY